MQEDGAVVYPELKEIVAEATRALAKLDAGRLEDLALCCQSLSRALNDATNESGFDDSTYERTQAFRAEVARQAREATGEMAIFSHVLSATRANLRVIAHVRTIKTESLSYSEQDAGWNWLEKES